MANKSIGSHLLSVGHFARDHWGEIYAAFDIMRGFIKRDPPGDNAHALVKLVHGGKHDIMDEIAYEQMEAGLTDEERATMVGFRNWMKAQFGEGLLGWIIHSDFDNDFRVMVLKYRSEPSVKVHTETYQNDKGKQVSKKTEEPVGPDIKPALAFLRRLIGTIPTNDDDGYRKGLRYLRDYNMPALTQLGIKARQVDDFLAGVPEMAKEAGQQAAVLLQSAIKGHRQSVKNRSWWRKLFL